MEIHPKIKEYYSNKGLILTFEIGYLPNNIYGSFIFAKSPHSLGKIIGWAGPTHNEYYHKGKAYSEEKYIRVLKLLAFA